MNDKNYKSISEVSRILDIKKHVIRYWDSKFEGISTRINISNKNPKNNTRRFFNKDNIEKLKELKNVLYQNGRHNYSLDLANKIVNKKSFKERTFTKNQTNKSEKIINELEEISINLKKLLK